jgi:hypothetical protein
MKKSLLLFAFLFTSILGQAQDLAVLTQRAQAEVIDTWLDDRITNLLPQLMTETGIDMWVVMSREYNEDPVIKTLLPATWMAARRRTILVMYQAAPNAAVETYAVARYDVGKAFKRAWDPEAQPDQWDALMKLISEKSPKKIGLNYAKDYGHADGLTQNEYQNFMDYLPTNLKGNVTSAQTLAVRWLETRTPAEMASYKHIQEIAHYIIQEGYMVSSFRRYSAS